MPKNDNEKSTRLYGSVKKNVGKEAADAMAKKVYLSKSADNKRKFEWANDVCNYLENNFDDTQIKKIRTDCSCTPPPEFIEAIRNMYQASGSLSEFCERYNATFKGDHSVWNEGDVLFFSYPYCYCDCVQHAEDQLSKTWCLCTVGYTKKLFDTALECNSDVELIESVKTGGKRCVMKINLR